MHIHWYIDIIHKLSFVSARRNELSVSVCNPLTIFSTLATIKEFKGAKEILIYLQQWYSRNDNVLRSIGKWGRKIWKQISNTDMSVSKSSWRPGDGALGRVEFGDEGRVMSQKPLSQRPLSLYEIVYVLCNLSPVLTFNLES